MRRAAAQAAADALAGALTKACGGTALLVGAWTLVLALAAMTAGAPAAWATTLAAALGAGLLMRVRGLPGGERRYALAWACVQAVSALVMLVVAFRINVGLSWDYGQLVKSASAYVLEGTAPNETYFSRYPNNQFWLTCLTACFFAVKALVPAAGAHTLYLASIVLAWGCVQCAMTVMHAAARVAWGRKRAFVFGAGAALCAPLYLYATFAYSDVAGLLLCSLLVYLCLRARRSAGVRGLLAWCALLGAAAALAWGVKVMVLIIVVAAGLDACLRRPRAGRLLAGACAAALAFACASAGVTAAAGAVARVSDEALEANRFPPVHWVMMSMEYGGYVKEDVDFTRDAGGYEDKKRADAERLLERVRARGAAGSAWHLLVVKPMRMWGDSTLAADAYLNREPAHPDGVLTRLCSADGDLHGLALLYTWPCHVLMLAGVGLSALLGWRRPARGQAMLVGRIALVGVFAFFTVWECNARYLFAFLPVLLLTSFSGWLGMYETMRHRRATRAGRGGDGGRGGC